METNLYFFCCFFFSNANVRDKLKEQYWQAYLLRDPHLLREVVKLILSSFPVLLF